VPMPSSFTSGRRFVAQRFELDVPMCKRSHTGDGIGSTQTLGPFERE
jgi:hypothetical protein